MASNNEEDVSATVRQFINLLTGFWEQLVASTLTRQILDQIVLDEIQKEMDTEIRIVTLIRQLCKIGPEGVVALNEILTEVGNQSGRELLDYIHLLDNNLEDVKEHCELQYLTSKLLRMASPSTSQATSSPSSSISQNASSASPTQSASNSLPLNSTRDGVGCSRMQPVGLDMGDSHGSQALSDVDEVRYWPVRPAIELRTSPRIYNMSKRPRGYCVIVNNFIFEPAHVKTRHGSEHEAVYLRVIFQQLGFRVIVHENKTCEKMLDIFDDLSQDATLESHDALVVIILTHGDRGVIMGSCGQHVAVESIVGRFNNYNCEYLRKKPKIFFIQACRGGAFDYGAVDPGAVADAVPRPSEQLEKKLPTLPTWTDTLICYSTVEGYVALRNEITGSWFGEAFGKVLMEHAWEYEIHGILSEVNRRLMKREGFDRIKQAIEVIYRGWSKAFYFNPGLYDENSTHF